MAQLDLLLFPLELFILIYTFIEGSHTVEIEVSKDGALLTHACKLLTVSQRIRNVVLNACANRDFQLIYTVRSPAALAHLLCAGGIQLHSEPLPIRAVRVVLLAELEGVKLTEEEERGADWGHVHPLLNAWRKAFQTAPLALKNTTEVGESNLSSIELLYFDFFRTFALDSKAVARLVHNLSFQLSRKTKGRARCRIIGSSTGREQRYIEKSTVNVVPLDQWLTGMETYGVKECEAYPSLRQTRTGCLEKE